MQKTLWLVVIIVMMMPLLGLKLIYGKGHRYLTTLTAPSQLADQSQQEKIPRAFVLSEFQGKRNGDKLNCDAIRSPVLISAHHLFKTNGISNIMFYGGVTRNAIFGREIGKDLDLLIVIDIDKRARLRMEWGALFTIFFNFALEDDVLDFYVDPYDILKIIIQDWSEDDFLRGRDGIMGLTQLREIRDEVKKLSDKDQIPEALSWRHEQFMEVRAHFNLSEHVKNYAEAVDEVYEIQYKKTRNTVGWEIAEAQIREMEMKLGIEPFSKLKISGVPIEVLGAIDGEGNLYDRPERKNFFKEILQETISSLGLTMDGRLFDPNGGMIDAEQGILRYVKEQDIETRINWIHVLRLLRFHFQFGFEYGTKEELIREYFKGIDGNKSSEEFLKGVFGVEAADFPYYVESIYFGALENGVDLDFVTTSLLTMGFPSSLKRNELVLQEAKLRAKQSYLKRKQTRPNLKHQIENAL